MNNNRKIIIPIVLILLLGLLVAGGTFAWWTWRSSDAEKTAVTFTVPDGSSQLSATLDMNNTNFRGLAPAANCAGRYAEVATVTLDYSNQTTATAAINATLSLVSVTGTHTGEIDRSQIHWALSENSKATCTSAIITNGTGTLSGIADGGAIYTGDLAVGTINTNTTGAKTLYLYFWIDPDYNFENVGNSVVTDPMQDMTIQVVWTGSISNAQSTSQWVYTANLYDENATNYNSVMIGSPVPSNITQYDTLDEAMAVLKAAGDGTTNYPFFLKHTTESDTVTESYVGFVVTEDMALANEGMTAGTYYLRGDDMYYYDSEQDNWFCKDEYIDSGTGECMTSQYYESNKSVLLSAFGSSYCSDNSFYFECRVSGLGASADSNGFVEANDDAGASCEVGGGGFSICNVSVDGGGIGN